MRKIFGDKPAGKIVILSLALATVVGLSSFAFLLKGPPIIPFGANCSCGCPWKTAAACNSCPGGCDCFGAGCNKNWTGCDAHGQSGYHCTCQEEGNWEFCWLQRDQWNCVQSCPQPDK